MVDSTAALRRGREAYDLGHWVNAYESLQAADRAAPLLPGDVELLARAAYMVGLDDDYVGNLERAHRVYVDTGDIARAVRCSWWIGHNWLFRGELARASGWFARGHRLLERIEGECVEHGYMLIPRWLDQMASGDDEAGLATAEQAAEIGERFNDADLVWIARDDQARALSKIGRLDEGLRLVNELLVVALAGELSPIVTGIVYCNTIAFCRDAHAVRQAREWTEALTGWCDSQPGMVAHMGLCLVHRAEILQLRGAWTEALAEAERAAERFTAGVLNRLACGQAHYRSGELHRLRGEVEEAEDAYREASRNAFEPQPGLALLRLSQGDEESAAAAIRRAVTEVTHPLDRAMLLPAYVEIMISIGEFERADAAGAELEAIADMQSTEELDATAAFARGAVRLVREEPERALVALRRSLQLWHELDVPYEAARTRVRIGLACRSLGDEESALLEFEAARETFRWLAADPDIVHVEALMSRPGSSNTVGLTERELEILRLVAAGKTNREIATGVVLSEHTVARHLQNIFAKLGVSNRTAAGAYAFEHNLV